MAIVSRATHVTNFLVIISDISSGRYLPTYLKELILQLRCTCLISNLTPSALTTRLGTAISFVLVFFVVLFSNINKFGSQTNDDNLKTKYVAL